MLSHPCDKLVIIFDNRLVSSIGRVALVNGFGGLGRFDGRVIALVESSIVSTMEQSAA
jgi:hypothetical protein